MIKYWFGYFMWHGVVEAIAWVEEDGLPTGGDPKYIQRYEITEAQFERLMLHELKTIHPFLEPPTTSPV